MLEMWNRRKGTDRLEDFAIPNSQSGERLIAGMGTVVNDLLLIAPLDKNGVWNEVEGYSKPDDCDFEFMAAGEASARGCLLSKGKMVLMKLGISWKREHTWSYLQNVIDFEKQPPLSIYIPILYHSSNTIHYHIHIKLPSSSITSI